MIKCLAGDPLDRVPVALWRHFPVEDQKPDRLARAVINFQKTYDFDFVKITPSSSFCVQDWGSQDEWQGNPEGSCAYIKYPVQNQDDWKLLQPLSIHEGALADQLEAIRFIRNELDTQTPIIQTIFNLSLRPKTWWEKKIYPSIFVFIQSMLRRRFKRSPKPQLISLNPQKDWVLMVSSLPFNMLRKFTQPSRI
jgi:hypothetical protein